MKVKVQHRFWLDLILNLVCVLFICLGFFLMQPCNRSWDSWLGVCQVHSVRQGRTVRKERRPKQGDGVSTSLTGARKQPRLKGRGPQLKSISGPGPTRFLGCLLLPSWSGLSAPERNFLPSFSTQISPGNKKRSYYTLSLLCSLLPQFLSVAQIGLKVRLILACPRVLGPQGPSLYPAWIVFKYISENEKFLRVMECSRLGGRRGVNRE